MDINHYSLTFEEINILIKKYRRLVDECIDEENREKYVIRLAELIRLKGQRNKQKMVEWAYWK